MNKFLQRLHQWVYEESKLATISLTALSAAILIGLVGAVVVAIIGINGMAKLDTANTNLWAAKQEIARLEVAIDTTKSLYETEIESLVNEIERLRADNELKAQIASAESQTPDTVWKFTGTANVQIKVNGNEAPNVRTAPQTDEFSHGKLDLSTNLQLEHFYAAPIRPQDGIGSWIGIPLILLDEPETHFLPTDAFADTDGVVWVSAQYLQFSDWMDNYPSEKVNLREDIVVHEE